MGSCCSSRAADTSTVKREGGFVRKACGKREGAAAEVPTAVPEADAVSPRTPTTLPTSTKQPQSCPCCTTPTTSPTTNSTTVADSTPGTLAVAAVESPSSESASRSESWSSSDGNGLPVPLEILRTCVFNLLGPSCLARAGSTCHVWREGAVDEHLWKKLCLRRWAGKHVALLEDCHYQQQQQQQQQSEGEAGGALEEQQQQQQQRRRREQQEQQVAAIKLAATLRGGLEELVAAMPIKVMKRRLQELGANPGRLAGCLEKDECVSLMMGSMLLSRKGLLREKGQLPPWLSRVRGWRWSYYFADKDAKRQWMTVEDLARTRWVMRFPGHTSSALPPPPLLVVPCEFHRDFSYTDSGFHQEGLEWHFEDNHRFVKVSSYPALEAERDTATWGWRLVNAHVTFEQQRARSR